MNRGNRKQDFLKSQRASSLVVRPRPESDESFFGFLIRLTEFNLYKKPSWILNKAGLSGHLFHANGVLNVQEVNFERFIKLTEITLAQLSEVLYRRGTNVFETIIFGQRVPQYLLRASRPRLCPKCLNQSEYCRKQWDLVPVTCCPIHNRLLLEECPACRKPITLYRNRVCYCSCGADWRQADTATVCESDAVVSRLVYEACGLIPRNATAQNPLYGLDLSSLLSVLLAVACLDGTPHALTRPLFLVKTSGGIHRKLLDAFSVFESWPSRFHSFLDRYFLSRPVPPTESFLAVFTPIMRRLCRSADASPFIQLILRTELQNYRTHWERKPRIAMWLAAKGKSPFLSRGAVRKILNVEPRVIDYLISNGTLTGVVKNKGQRGVFMLDADNVEKLKREWARGVSLFSASGYLGISKRHILMLLQHSLLIGSKVQSNNRLICTFNASDLNRLLAEVFSRARKVHSVSTGRFCRFKDLLGALTVQLANVPWGMHILIDDILKGVITPRYLALKKTNLRDLYFSRQQIKEYIRRKLGGEEPELIRVDGEAEEYGFRTAQLHFFAQKGLIETEHVYQRKTHCKLITRKAILTFKSHYIDAATLSQATGTRVDFLVRALESRTVYPVSGRSIDGGPRYIYRRTDLAHLDLKKLIDTSRMVYSEKSTPSYPVDSRAAAKILSLKKTTIAQLVKNGVLKPYSESPDGAGDYLFNSAYIERLVGQFTDLTNLITARAAREILQTKSVYQRWVKRGYLKYEISRDGKKRFLVKSEVERIARFLDSIVNCTQAAPFVGISRWNVVSFIRKERLKPIKNPYPLAVHNVIYWRTDFEKLMGRNSSGSVNGKRALNKLSNTNQNRIRQSHLPVVH